MFAHVISQTMGGKTVNRLLMNESVRNYELHGKVLDLGAGNIRSSYLEFFQKRSGYAVASVDISAERNPDIVANLERPIPLGSDLYDFVLCFNLLEHIYNHQQLLAEICRVLKPGGALIGYVPFLVKYHPDPNDFFRYTEQGLRGLFSDARFHDVQIQFIGRGPLTAAWAQCEFILPHVVRWPMTLAVFALDSLLLRLKPIFKKRYPLGYTFLARK